MQLQLLHSSVTFREGGTNIIEIELDEDTIDGTFMKKVKHLISGISTVTDQDVSFTPYSIVTGYICFKWWCILYSRPKC